MLAREPVEHGSKPCHFCFEVRDPGREGRGLIGITVAIFVLAALVSALVVSLRRPWARIVVRVAGSWIAAIGLLLLGWTLSGRS